RPSAKFLEPRSRWASKPSALPQRRAQPGTAVPGWRAALPPRSITRVSGNAVYLSVKWGYCSDKSGKIALDLLSLLCCARSLS
ncbi:MAG: hypothetical protein RSC06_13895, partial [Clostridia bacterium]